MDPSLYFGDANSVYVLLCDDDVDLFAKSDQSNDAIPTKISGTITLKARGTPESFWGLKSEIGKK